MRNIEPNKYEIGEELWATTDRVMVLSHTYDSRQLWFPFVSAFYRLMDTPKPPRPYQKSKKLNVNRKIPLDARSSCLFYPEEGVHQMVLPFNEAKLSLNNAYTRLLHTNFPAFERDSDGNLLVARARRNDEFTKRWIKDHCEGRVAMKSTVIFEKLSDFLIAILGDDFEDFRDGFRRSHHRSPQ